MNRTCPACGKPLRAERGGSGPDSYSEHLASHDPEDLGLPPDPE